MIDKDQEVAEQLGEQIHGSPLDTRQGSKGDPASTGQPSDQLAARLARDGDPEPVHIEENDTSFVIDWKGNYRIEGPAFIYSDRQTRRVSTILGYPTHLLAPPS